jgi:hypothetical protein
MRFRAAITGFSGVLVVFSLAVANASAASFTTPVKLVGANSSGAADPTSGPFGGEPSIATDPLGHVYVQSPEGIPSGANGTPGSGFWISNDDGTTFSPGKYIGSYLGGGDGDVIVANTPKVNTVFNADLEAAGTEICQSTDFGKTFTGVGPFPDPSNCTTINGGQAGPSDDRPWLTYDPKSNDIFLTYHEFVSAQPLAFVSTNGGADDFANPCGPLVTDPTIEANIPQDVTGGTLVARPVVDKAGNLYVLFATTTQQENAAAAAGQQPSGTFSQLYLAVSKDHCQSFSDYTIYDGTQGGTRTNTVQFGDIFNDLAIDGAGDLYVVGDGFVNTPSDTATTWFLKSTDGGQHWTTPAQLDSPHAAYMLPAAIGGPQAGQLAIGYFRTTNGVTDPNSTSGVWTYSTAESTDANGANPTFRYADVNPGYAYHTGQICNAGILCGLPGEPSDRSLLDFTSVTLDPQGCPLYVFAGNTPKSLAASPAETWNFVTRQTSDCFSSAGPQGGGDGSTRGGGGSTQGGGGSTKGSGGKTQGGSGGRPNAPRPSSSHHAKAKPHARKHPKHKQRKKHHKRHTRRHARARAADDLATIF